MKNNKALALLHKTALVLYKTTGVIFLYSILTLILSYPVLLGFYATSDSWCAPIILTASEDKILALTQQVVTGDESLGALTFALDQAKVNLLVMGRQKTEFVDLLNRLDKEAPKELRDAQNRKQALYALDVEKRQNNDAADTLNGQVSGLQAQVNKDLTLGLITKNDAVTLLSSINQVQTNVIDGKIGEVALQDTISQKSPESTTWLTIQAQRAELSAQIAQIDVSLKSAQDQIEISTREIVEMKTAIDKAKNTPYYLASLSSQTVFAFVPYDNQRKARIGASVFDCALSMMVCHYAGKIARVFGDEEQGMNPVLKTPTRGFLVELNLFDEQAGKSKTLMIGHKPFLF